MASAELAAASCDAGCLGMIPLLLENLRVFVCICLVQIRRFGNAVFNIFLVELHCMPGWRPGGREWQRKSAQQPGSWHEATTKRQKISHACMFAALASAVLAAASCSAGCLGLIPILLETLRVFACSSYSMRIQ